MPTQELFSTEISFADLGLSPPLLKAIEGMGFEHPTIVQSQIIPHALKGKDVLGQSKTGSGKTAAFGLPVLQVLDGDSPPPSSSLILTPTRELAVQVAREIHELAKHTHLKVAAIYGGQKISVQAEKLKKGAHIIVGTPGRVMDMHGRGYLKYDNIQIAILDEVDRMLDIGFREDIRRILGNIRVKHQTIFVSATISGEIEVLARRYMKNPVNLAVKDQGSLTVAQVKQTCFGVEPWDKKRLLVHLLKHEAPTLTLVFCRTKQTVDGLTAYLNRKNIEAHSIHGDMYQGKRDRIMRSLRAGDLSVLVCSDLAARGLDVDNISHVINYDIPDDPEIYVHRIGRTARAGKKGIAWTFAMPDQGEMLTNIEMLTNVELPLETPPGFKAGPIPKDIAAQQELAAERMANHRSESRRTTPTPPPSEKSVDPSQFPGGIVPTALPKRRLGGRLRSRRGR